MADKRPHLVLIEWEDSHHRPGWTADAAEPEPLICRSVGWLVGSTKEAKTLAANITQEDNPQRCGDMTIPARSIRKIKRLAGF